MNKMCPRCGRTEDSQADGGHLAFVGSFCIDCFLRQQRLFRIPDCLKLARCSRCNRARFARDWSKYSDEALIEWIKPKLKAESLSDCVGTVRQHQNNLLVDLEMEFVVAGAPLRRGARVSVELDCNACPDCRRKSGGYHEAIIQLRGGTVKQRERMSRTLEHEISENSCIASVEEIKEGLDMYVVDRRAAQSAVRSLGLPHTIANKLVGEKQGRRIYRATLCVRL